MENIAFKKAKQIQKYYLFHKKIKNIFKSGINSLYKIPNGFFSILLAHNINKKDTLYIIDLDWIKNWKEYSGYNSVFKNFENIKQSSQNSEEEFEEEIKEMCDNMVLTQEINNIDNNKSNG